MNSFQRLLPVTAVVLLALGASEVLAQQTSNTFNEQFVNVFDPESRTYFSLATMQGNQFGGQQPYTSLGATNFQGSIDSAVTLFNGQVLVNNNGNPAGTFGVQYRRLYDLRFLNTTILGAGVYMDLNQSTYNNLFEQMNVNLEMMTESAWVARLNGYFPVGEIQQQTGVQSQLAGSSTGQLSLVGNQVWVGGINSQLMNVALMGSDLEFGRKFFGYRAEVYGGYYTWNGPLVGLTNGVKGGVRGYVMDNLWANVNVSHDTFFGTNVYGGLTYFFGGRGGSRPLSFLNLMTSPAIRAQQTAITTAWRTTDTFHAAKDISGDPLNVYFVEQAGAGTGVQNNPSNVTSVLGNPDFGRGSAMVLLSNNGPITTPITLLDRQQVIGGGPFGMANIDFSQALGQAPGTSILHLTGLGSPAVLAPTSGSAITLANQNTIQGFTIDGASGLTNGIVGLSGANGTLIQDMLIQNVSGVGINISPSTNTTIDHVAFVNNGQDVLLDAQNSIITNITSTGATNGSISLDNITGVSLIQNAMITGAGGFGGIQLSNAQAGSTVNLSNVSITGGSGAGVTVSNALAGSYVNMTNVGIDGVGGAGVSLQNSAGTLNANNATSIIDPMGVGLLVNGGSADVTFNGSIYQANNAAAVYVYGNHTGTIDFTSVSSITATTQAILPPPIGTGLVFGDGVSTGANGTYNFLGTTNISGANPNIFINQSSGTFTFDNTTINTQSAGVKIVGVGSGLPQATFNNLNVTTSSNFGFFLSGGGTATVNGSTFNVTASDALYLTNSTFTLNNTTVTQTVGYTINSTDSVLNGTGNTSATYSGNNGGGNSGTISFNNGTKIFPLDL